MQMDDIGRAAAGSMITEGGANRRLKGYYCKYFKTASVRERT